MKENQGLVDNYNYYKTILYRKLYIAKLLRKLNTIYIIMSCTTHRTDDDEKTIWADQTSPSTLYPHQAFVSPQSLVYTIV